MASKDTEEAMTLLRKLQVDAFQAGWREGYARGFEAGATVGIDPQSPHEISPS